MCFARQWCSQYRACSDASGCWENVTVDFGADLPLGAVKLRNYVAEFDALVDTALLLFAPDNGGNDWHPVRLALSQVLPPLRPHPSPIVTTCLANITIQSLARSLQGAGVVPCARTLRVIVRHVGPV
jgi:hypothetical protein